MPDDTARRLVYVQLLDETGAPIWRLPFGIAYKSGLEPDVVSEILQSDPNIVASNLTFAGRTAYTLKPEALPLVQR